MNLLGKHTAVYGLKGVGKSNWTQWLCRRPAMRNHLIYDVCREHSGMHRYIPEHRHGDEAEAELNGVVERTITNNNRDRRPDMFVLEEASRFCGSRSPPPEALYDVIDLSRHYGVGLVSIARRPAQVHSDLTELADNVIIFRLTGKNDYKALERMVEGLGDTVRSLDDYQFARVTPDRKIRVHDPVPEMDTTGAL